MESNVGKIYQSLESQPPFYKKEWFLLDDEKTLKKFGGL